MTQHDHKTLDMVQEFHDAFGLNETKPEFWAGMIREEINEVQEALAELLKEACDVAYVVSGYLISLKGENVSSDHEALLDEGTQVLIAARALFSDQRLTEAFNRVHESNMSKLGEDGKPIYREDGKVLKGPNYKPPHLLDLVSG